MKNRLLLIDGDNYLSRIFFVNKIVIQETEKGEEDIIDVWETIDKTLKILTYLQNLLNYGTYDDIIVMFDTPTWKDANKEILLEIIDKFGIWGEWYKGQRKKRPAFDKYKQIFSNLLYLKWFKIAMSAKYEADDVIWTFAKRHENDYNEVHILSQDNDLYQVLNETISVVEWIWKDHVENPFTRGKMKLKMLSKTWIRIDNEEDIVYVKAILWDKSDNIPWVHNVWKGKLKKAMGDELSIIETELYKEHKELIDAFVPLIKLNTNIRDDEMKILHWQKDDRKYSNYLLQVEGELNIS